MWNAHIVPHNIFKNMYLYIRNFNYILYVFLGHESVTFFEIFIEVLLSLRKAKKYGNNSLIVEILLRNL